MGIFSRIAKVIESNLNAMVDRAEDPAKVLDQAIADMKKGRETAQAALIQARTELKLTEKRRNKANEEARAYEEKAILALGAGDEGLARRLVELKLQAEERTEAEDGALAQHKRQIDELQAADRELERKLQELPGRRAALMARKAAAEARGASSGASNAAQGKVADALGAFERIEEKIIRSEVEVEVLSERSPLLELESGVLADRKTDLALAELKAKMAALPEPSGRPVAAIPAQTGDARVEDSLAALKSRLDKKG